MAAEEPVTTRNVGWKSTFDQGAAEYLVQGSESS